MKSGIYDNTWYNPTKGELKIAGIQAPIAFDMDGVLSETGDILYQGICKKFGVKDIRTIVNGYQTFQYAVPGVEGPDMFAAVNEIIGNEAGGALPTPFMAEVIQYIYFATGNPITIVTARVKENMDTTYTWLKENLPDVPFNLIMVNGMQKEVVLKRIGTEIFIDDRYKTVVRLEQEINLSVLYSRPWNQGRPVPAGDMVINDLRDIIPIVNYMTRQPVMNWPGNVPYPNRVGYKGVEYA